MPRGPRPRRSPHPNSGRCIIFTIIDDRFGRHTRINLVNSCTGERVSVIPDYGATVTDITLTSGAALHAVLDGAKTEEELHDGVQFKGAKLLPFPNRICDGSYEFGGQQYQLAANFGQDAVHGFAYNQQFMLSDAKADQEHAEVFLRYSYKASHEGYPFPFEATLKLSLSQGRGFKYQTTVINTGPTPMPVGDGWHPYFSTGSAIDRLQLHLPAAQRMEVNERRMPTGRLLPQVHQDGYPIGEQKFVDCYELEDRGGLAVTRLHDPDRRITISFWQETGAGKYNYFMLFTPASRESIAIEPMTCPVNAFNSRTDVTVLNRGEALHAACGVSLSPDFAG